MKDYSAVSAYQQSTARGASPVGLIISLYDTILRDFRRALAAVDSGAVETRIFELNHALTVIAHLESVLDHRQGGEAAARLTRFYEVTHGMILEASVTASRASLLKLVDLYTTLRQAWQQTEQQLASSPVNTTAGVSAVPVPELPLRTPHPRPIDAAPVTESTPIAASDPSASRGRWSA
jgi:flagellar biosynthetic protein FliS